MRSNRFEILVVLLTSSFFLFCERKNMLKENKKAVSPDFYLQPSVYIYIHVYFVHRTVYIYTITTVHLDFFWALQVSRPDPRAHI